MGEMEVRNIGSSRTDKGGGHGSVVERSPATLSTRVRFPDGAPLPALRNRTPTVPTTQETIHAFKTMPTRPIPCAITCLIP